MKTLRESRGIEQSVIDLIREKLIDDNWEGVTVCYTFGQVYERTFSDDFPILCVRTGTTRHERIEMGSHTTKRYPNLFIDIFATSESNARDLKDWLIDTLKSGWNYYVYSSHEGEVKSKTKEGRVTVLNILDESVNFNIDKNALDVRDQFRWLLTFEITISELED